MATTPSNRLKLTPSNSPFLGRPSRSPIRPRAVHESRLSLKRVVGTTCSSPSGFDSISSSFAYIAGGAVVVVDVQDDRYSQRFYRARPTAVPVFAVSQFTHASSLTPNSTPKANDSRNRVAPIRDSFYGGPADWSDSPSAKTWTSRERIKAATCLALSQDGRFLAVGETGYAPRVLIFNLEDNSSDIPLVSISEHLYGVKAVAWSRDARYLASLGTANDGCLYIWKVDPRTGAAKLFQQNRCNSYVRDMVWMGNSLITMGVRHIKVWRVEEAQSGSPTKNKFAGDGSFSSPQTQKTLPGRNILLGSMLDATFTCAAIIDDCRAVVCSETGDVCLLDDTNKQMKLTKVTEIGFIVTCVAIRNQTLYVGGKLGQFATINVADILAGGCKAVVKTSPSRTGLGAMGFLDSKLVTIDATRSIDIWDADRLPTESTSDDDNRITIPAHGDPIVGIQKLSEKNHTGASFFTWSGSGRVKLWDMEGRIKASFNIPFEQVESEADVAPINNQLSLVRATDDAKVFLAGDRMGVLRVFDFATQKCVVETKAHALDCQDIALREEGSRTLMASCGRDRTVQLFCKTANGTLEHFQTLEFAAKVVQVLFLSDDRLLTCSLDRTLQVYDLVSKPDEPDIMAAIPVKVITLKASPSSMVISPDEKSAFISLMDRSVCQYDISSGRLLNSFKCTDEGSVDSVILDSLIHGQALTSEPTFLLGISNTDKSVRIYDSQSGGFLDREWGHTEAINGVILVDDEDSNTGRKVVSVGEDGTIMVWILDLRDPVASSMSRDPSPEKPPPSTSTRPPLRRVLSKAELAEFQRPSPTQGRRSPPRPLVRRTSAFSLRVRTPGSLAQAQPSPSAASMALEETPSRRASSAETESGPSSPPNISPGNSLRRSLSRRPSLPVLNSSPSSSTMSGGAAAAARKKASATNLRASYGFGTLGMATEQTCRQLRAYRKKLAGPEHVSPDVLAELDAELRLTAAALGERAIRSRRDGKAVSETVLNGLLDQYSERLVSMLDEKLRLRAGGGRDQSAGGGLLDEGEEDDDDEGDGVGALKPRQMSQASVSVSASGDGDGEGSVSSSATLVSGGGGGSSSSVVDGAR